MPRLAPVRSNVLRGALWDEVAINWFSVCVIPGGIWISGSTLARRAGMTSGSRVQPRFRPGLIRPIAAEFDAIVQTERAVVPEFEPQRRNAPAAPAGRARHLADHVLCGDLANGLLEGKAAFERL